MHTSYAKLKTSKFKLLGKEMTNKKKTFQRRFICIPIYSSIAERRLLTQIET
jgi:hypothetical protein